MRTTEILTCLDAIEAEAFKRGGVIEMPANKPARFEFVQRGQRFRMVEDVAGSACGCPDEETA